MLRIAFCSFVLLSFRGRPSPIRAAVFPGYNVGVPASR